MDQDTSGHSSPGQRTLAAVVFTDVVGFSARMGADEVGTIKLLNRDFAEMRRLCAEHGGSVLKTTGDGLLLTFSSAVHAVACALAMQRQFAEEVKSKPGALQHRVGIHLGDILFHNQDVMGDGVNIASRLQGEAEPGGICISQTVYDVVKNKVKMQAVSVGPRELKNISDAIPVYRILLEAQALASGSKAPISVQVGATAHATPTTLVSDPTPARGNRHGLWIGLGIAVVFIVGVGVVVVRPRLAPAPAPAAPTATAVAPPAAAPTTAAATATGMSDEDFAKEIARRKDQMEQSRKQFLEKYDFAGFAKELKEKGGSVPQGRAGVPSMVTSAEQMAATKEWLDFVMPQYQRNRPLIVTDFVVTDPNAGVRMFGAPGNKVVMMENGAPTPPRAWSDIPPPIMGRIIISAIRNARPQPPRDVLLGARSFGQFFNLPAMLEAMNGIMQVQGARQGQNPNRQGQGPRAGRQ